MSTLNDTDLFVIERSGTNYQVRSNEMSTLQDTDLFVVERSGTNYQVEAKDINLGPTGTIEKPVAVLTPFNGAGTNAGEPYQPLSTAITAVGAGGEVVYATDTIASVVTGGTLTSISCFQDTDSGSSAVAAIYVDGVILTNSGVGSVTEGTFTNDGSTNTIAPMFDGNTSTSCFSLNQGFATFTFSPPITFNTLEVRGWTSNSFSPVYVNGEAVPGMLPQSNGGLSTVAIGNTTLTFPTDNNFDKFEVGEVVQSTSFEEAFGVSAGDPFYWGKNGTVFDRYVDIPVIPGTSYFAGVTSPGGEDGRTEIYDENNTMYNAWNNGDGYLGASVSVSKEDSTKFIIPAGFTGNVTRLYMVNSAGSVSRGTVVFSYDGVTEYTSTDGAVNTSITAIDADGPTITTDGGSWYGADGTGDAGEPGDGRYMPDANWGSTLISDKSITSPDNAFDGINDTSNSASVDQNGYLQFPLPEVLDGDFDVLIRAHFSNQETIDTSILNSSGNVIETVRNNNIASNVVTTVSFTDIVGAAAIKTICAVSGTEGSGPGSNADKITHLIGVKYNDQQFISSSVSGGPTPPGATDITKTVSSDASLTFTSDLELANMVGPLSQVDENGDVKTPVTSEIASVASESQWNQSRTWSNEITSPDGTISSTYDASNAFSGNLTTRCQTTEAGKTIRWTPASGIVLTSSFRVYTGAFSGGISARVSGTDYVLNANGNNVPASGYVDSTVTTGNLEYIDVQGQTGAGDGYVTGYAVNGKLMVNDGIPNPPIDEILTFEAPNPDLQFFQPGDQIGTESGFAPVAYTGNSGTQSITGVGFSPDLVWIKVRSTTGSNPVSDTVRGFGASGSSKIIYTDATNAQDTGDTQILKSFDNDGFTVGTNALVNQSGQTYIAWCWDASDTTVTNNDGTLESQVRSNGNFSVVTYAGNQQSGATIGHGLSTNPAMIILKRTNNNSNWAVYHSALGAGQNIRLDETGGAFPNTTFWAGVEPTSSVFSIGNDLDVNASAGTYVAYAWAETPGVSSFGEYAGTNDVNGPVIDCGFEPAFILIKSATSTSDWQIWDSARSPSNPADKTLRADLSAAEEDGVIDIDILPNGFQLRNTIMNTGSTTFIYAAFAGPNPIEVIDVDVAANTMTVDGGDWFGQDGTSAGGDGRFEPSQMWSDRLTSDTQDPSYSAPGGFPPGYPRTNAFNGQPGTAAGTTFSSGNPAGDPNRVGVITFDASGLGIEVTSNVFVWSNKGAGNPATVTVTTSNGTFTGTNSDTTDSSGVSLDCTGTLISVTASTQDPNFRGIKVDGKVLVDSSVPGGGESQVTGPPLIASADDVEYLDGNTLGVNGVSGTWLAGLHAQGAEVTAYAPSPESIVFTSMNAGTTEFTGTDATLTSRTWTLEKSTAVTGPWTEVGVFVDFAANASQDGATPWDNPTLEANTFYQVKVEYSSNNAASVVSTFNTFKTGDA